VGRVHKYPVTVVLRSEGKSNRGPGSCLVGIIASLGDVPGGLVENPRFGALTRAFLVSAGAVPADRVELFVVAHADPGDLRLDKLYRGIAQRRI
jgi:hypothetical protein